MPESSTEIEELRRRVEQQAQRIDELQDALHTLSVAVQYREEEPYLAFLAEHGIAGRRRIALMTAIAGVLSRAQGEVLGSERLGKQALEAHRARGLGLEGHQALTSRPADER